MSSIAKTSISLSKKDLTKSRIPPVASRNVVFYHQATAGQTVINLTALTMPSEMPTQVQITSDELSGAKLATNKKNLELTSSANGVLIQGLHYLVVDGYTIQLIGPYTTVGAELGEIFVGKIVNAPVSDLTVISARDIVKTTTAAVGQSIVNLGNEYQVGANPLENVGAVRIWINGVMALRGIDYLELDPDAAGFGSTIQLINTPTSVPWQIVAEFGIRSVTDQDALGTIESLSGAVKKIANDLADVAGTSSADYLNANPSEIERRTFGDIVLDLNTKYDSTRVISDITKTKWQRKILTTAYTSSQTIPQISFNNLTIGKTYRVTAVVAVSGPGAGGAGLFYNHDGVTILNIAAGAGTAVDGKSGGSVIFTATATSLIANAQTNATTIVANSTWGQLEELPNHEITNQW